MSLLKFDIFRWAFYCIVMTSIFHVFYQFIHHAWWCDEGEYGRMAWWTDQSSCETCHVTEIKKDWTQMERGGWHEQNTTHIQTNVISCCMHMWCNNNGYEIVCTRNICEVWSLMDDITSDGMMLEGLVWKRNVTCEHELIYFVDVHMSCLS